MATKTEQTMNLVDSGLWIEMHDEMSGDKTLRICSWPTCILKYPLSTGSEVFIKHRRESGI